MYKRKKETWFCDVKKKVRCLLIMHNYFFFHILMYVISMTLKASRIEKRRRQAGGGGESKQEKLSEIEKRIFRLMRETVLKGINISNFNKVISCMLTEIHILYILFYITFHD